ncbi:MAG: hypothetical protein ACRC41_13020 [Sarcina sp.]
MNKKCPVCGEKEYIDIIYGYPSKRLIELVKEAELQFGGEIIKPGSMSKCCKTCKVYYNYEIPPMRELKSLKINIDSFVRGSSYFYMDEINLFYAKSEKGCLEDFTSSGIEDMLSKKIIIKPSLSDEEKGKLICKIENYLDYIHIDSWKQKDDVRKESLVDADKWGISVTYSNGKNIAISGFHDRPVYWTDLIKCLKEETGIEIEKV